MVRRSTPPRITDDRYFPVRIAVPQGGFGEPLNVMHGWLNMHAGRGNFAIHSAPNDLSAITGVDAALFYFADVSVAKAFVERFACGLAVITTAQSRMAAILADTQATVVAMLSAVARDHPKRFWTGVGLCVDQP